MKKSSGNKLEKPASRERVKRDKKGKDDDGGGQSKVEKLKSSFLREQSNQQAEEQGEEKAESDLGDTIPVSGDLNGLGSRSDNRVKWCAATMQTSFRVFFREYMRNKKIKPENYTYEAYKRHDERNRYNDILCIDSTRVILKNRDESADYIHASWITLPTGGKFICTQGPLTETFEDFWHMIISERSPCVVMLCALTESGEQKCDRYYPKVGAVLDVGTYKIKHVKQKDCGIEGIESHIYDILIKDVFVWKVSHYMFTTWTDHVAPSDPGPAVKLLRTVRAEAKDGPVTVHCSAGIGRTSTFVGIEYAAQRIKDNAQYSLIDLLKELRSQRFHAVQGPYQFMFLVIAIIEFFIQEEAVKRTQLFNDFKKSYVKKLEKYKPIGSENKDDSKRKKKGGKGKSEK